MVLFGLIMGAQVVEGKDITTVDFFSGESKQAERALTDAGLRPTEEVVLIQNKKLEATDPAFKAVIARTAATLKQTEHVANVATPFDGKGGAISDDRHSVLVDFEVTGPDVDSAVNVVESENTVKALAAASSDFNGRDLHRTLPTPVQSAASAGRLRHAVAA